MFSWNDIILYLNIVYKIILPIKHKMLNNLGLTMREMS